MVRSETTIPHSRSLPYRCSQREIFIREMPVRQDVLGGLDRVEPPLNRLAVSSAWLSSFPSCCKSFWSEENLAGGVGKGLLQCSHLRSVLPHQAYARRDLPVGFSLFGVSYLTHALTQQSTAHLLTNPPCGPPFPPSFSPRGFRLVRSAVRCLSRPVLHLHISPQA